MSNALCLGGSIIQILPGYWRSDTLSENVYRCNILKYGCKGGTTDDLCEVSYEGPLCGVCVYNKTLKYFRNVLGYCELCKESNLFYAISVLIIVFLILIFLIYFSIQESYEFSNSLESFNDNVTVLINILINYLQKLSSISNIEIKWPNSGSTSNSLSLFNDFGNMIGIFECPFSEFALQNDYRLITLKRLLSTICFFMIILGSILFWIIRMFWRNLIYKQNLQKKTIDNIVITLIAIYVIGLQPMLNFYTKSLYCIEINGENYLKISTNLECWVGEHMTLIMHLILPVSFLFIFPPLYLLNFITKNRNQLENKKYLLISYLVTTGYKKKYFYWEYFLLLTKIILMLISIFTNDKPIICVMLLIIVFFIFILIQCLISPFEKDIYNKLEIVKLTAIYFSYSSNFFFYYEENESIITFILFLMGLFNGIFLIFWTVLLFRNMKPTFSNAWNIFITCFNKIKSNISENPKFSSESKSIDKKRKILFEKSLDQIEPI